MMNPDAAGRRRCPPLVVRTGIAWIAVVTFLVSWKSVGFRYDNPFITLVYARNLLEGRGLVFNAGERVQGFTSPLHVFVMAAAGWIAGTEALPILAAWLSLAGLGAAGLFTYLFYVRQGRPWCGLFTSTLLLLNVRFLQSFGLETTLLAALAIAAAWAFWERRDGLCTALLIAGTLTRPDAALLAVILLAIRYGRERTWPWRQSLLYLVAVGAWYAWAWRYFGHPLPTTLSGKQLQGADPAYAESLLAAAWRGLGAEPVHFLVWCVPFGAALLWLRRPWAPIPLVLWGLLQWSLYFPVLGVASIYPWYHVPVVVAWTYLIGEGAAFVGGWSWGLVRNRGEAGAEPRAADTRVAAVGTLSVLVLASLLALGWAVRFHCGPSPPMGMSDHIRGLYIAGEWIDRWLPENVSVAQGEIGALGWTARRRMLDLSYLISTPEMIADTTAEVLVISRDMTWVGQPSGEDWVLLVCMKVSRDHRGVEIWARPQVAATLAGVDLRRGTMIETRFSIPVDLQLETGRKREGRGQAPSEPAGSPES